MIAAIIFVIHLLAAVYAFVTRKKEGGIGEGLLAVAFFAIIFSVGWTISTMLTSLAVDPEGIATWLDRDALALAVLTIAEGFFYYFLLRSKNRSEESAGNDPGGTI